MISQMGYPGTTGTRLGRWHPAPTLALLIAVLAAACGPARLEPARLPVQPPAVAGPVAVADPPALPAVDGVLCGREVTALHFHAHLDLYQDGRLLPVPGAIGRPPGGCIYETHTHSEDGVIHVDGRLDGAGPALGQFFAVWGQTLSRFEAAGVAAPGGLRVYVDGTLVAGDPGAIELRPHRDITIESGRLVPPQPYAYGGGG